MKRIVLTVTILLLSSVFAWAEISGVPQLVNYQGKLTDANGDPLVTAQYKLEFNIYDDATGGSIKWGPQTFGSVPVVRGYFNVILGPVDTGNRSIMDGFSGPNRYLGIKINDGTEIQPRQQILSAPYAISAGEISFASKNTDWGRIHFESTGDEAYESNIVFDTYDNHNEGFIFRTTGIERARIDDRALFLSRGMLSLGPTGTIAEGAEIFWGGAGSYKNWHQDICGGNMRFWSDETGTGDTLVLKGNGDVAIKGLLSMKQALSLGTTDTVEEGGEIFWEGAGSYKRWHQDIYQDKMRFWQDGWGTAHTLVLGGNGNVAIGTFPVGNYRLYVNGSFGSHSKFFDIQDPRYNDEKRRLVHSTLEGPEIAVYYRGEAKLINRTVTIELPSYFEVLTRKEARTVLLTAKNGWSPLYVNGEVKDGKFMVKTTEQGNPGQEFYWEVKAVRSDVEPLEVQVIRPE